MRIELYPPLFIYETGQRQNQEDAISQWNNRLFVLCDGMGGHEKGEVASQTVCQSLTKWFEEHIHLQEPFTDDQFREAIAYAYTELDKHDDGSPKKMGTTLTLLYIHTRGATAAHIGDSRIYHVRPSVGLLYQSRDHSLVFDLFQAGEISYGEMLTYPQKNIVTRAMTPGEDNRMYNPQNEMFRKNKTKRSGLQNEAFLFSDSPTTKNASDFSGAFLSKGLHSFIKSSILRYLWDPSLKTI